MHLSVAPVGRAVAAELALKLEAPDLAFNWSGLMAADMASKARVFQALTGGGMDAGAAAGLEVWRCRTHAPIARLSCSTHNTIRGPGPPALASAGDTLRPPAWTGATTAGGARDGASRNRAALGAAALAAARPLVTL